MEKEIISNFNLNRLIKNTDIDRIRKAVSEIRSIKLSKISQPSNSVYKKSGQPRDIDPNLPATFDMTIKSSSGETYITRIKFQKKLAWSSPVRVRCSCSDYLYRLGHVMYTSNAHLGKLSAKAISDAPKVTNPRGKRYLCKHLIASINALDNRGFIKR